MNSFVAFPLGTAPWKRGEQSRLGKECSRRISNHIYVSLAHGVRAHGPGVRGESEEGQAVEDGPIEEAVCHVLSRQQYDEQHHELGVEDQEPGDDAAHDAAAVADEPHGVRVGAGRGRRAVLGLQVASLALDVPGAMRGALHSTKPGAGTACCVEQKRDGTQVANQCIPAPLLIAKYPLNSE